MIHALNAVYSRLVDMSCQTEVKSVCDRCCVVPEFIDFSLLVKWGSNVCEI